MNYALEIAKLANEACGSRDQWDRYSEGMHEAATRADDEIAALRHQLGPGAHIAHKDDWWCGGCNERFVGAADTYATRASCPTCGCWVQSYWERRVEVLEASLRDLVMLERTVAPDMSSKPRTYAFMQNGAVLAEALDRARSVLDKTA